MRMVTSLNTAWLTLLQQHVSVVLGFDCDNRMSDLSAAGRQRAQRRSNNEAITEDSATTSAMVLCVLCSSPASVSVVPSVAAKHYLQREGSTVKKLNHSKNSRNPKETLCLLHYYTTDACRRDPANQNKDVTVTTILNSDALQKQLPKQQEMFAEAFLQVQREIQDAITSHSTNTGPANKLNENDPLSIIVNLNQHSHKKRNYQHLSFKKRTSRQQTLEGGFLRDIPIPERLKLIQQQQACQQQELITRMNQPKIPIEYNPTKRRMPSRASVWQVLSNDDRKPAAFSMRGHVRMESIADEILTNQVTCSCGSQQVQIVSSNSNRNQDMSKAETWGSKDRHDEIVCRYACAQCGKVWNEAG